MKNRLAALLALSLFTSSAHANPINPPEASTTTSLVFGTNYCAHKLRMLVMVSLHGQPLVSGWYTLAKREIYKPLELNGMQLRHGMGENLYIYSYQPGRPSETLKGNHKARYRSKTYGMAQVIPSQFGDDGLNIVLACDDPEPDDSAKPDLDDADDLIQLG